MDRNLAKAYLDTIASNNKLVTEQKNINGYRLVRTGCQDYNSIITLKEVWNEEGIMSDEEFKKKFLAEACDEWAVNNDFGEPYSNEFFDEVDSRTLTLEEAKEKTLARNCEKIIALPYKKSFVYHTLHILCNYGGENIMVLNSFCHFFSDLMSRIPNSNQAHYSSSCNHS